MTTVHTPSLGWIDIDVSIDALFADAHATAAEHADRLYRRFQAHALCEWQQPVCDAPVDIPDEDDPTEGDEPPIDWGNDRTPAAPRMSLSSPAPLGTPADATAASSVGLHRCPATGRAYPDGVARVATGQRERVVWTLCPWCDRGDGNPQPHPWEVRDVA